MSKSAQISSEGLRSWQEINQHAEQNTLSPAARRNRLVRWAGWSATVFTGLLFLLLSVWAVRSSHAAPVRGADGPLVLPLAKVQFTTDGVLTEAWVRDFLHLNAGDPLEKIDVFALREKLLDTKQVSEALIERLRPATLHIALKERHPVLRVAVDNGAGGYKLYLVARDGTVFAGLDFPDIVLGQVPWMSGLALHRAKDGGGFDAVPGMDAVADLLKTARDRAPQIAAQWAVLDLSQFDPRPQAPLSLIKVPKSGDLGQLTFETGDFSLSADDRLKLLATQVDRLTFAAHTVQDKALLVSGLDMSIPNQVVVRLLAAPSSTRRLR